jgi:hypothetical protein
MASDPAALTKELFNCLVHLSICGRTVELVVDWYLRRFMKLFIYCRGTVENRVECSAQRSRIWARSVRSVVLSADSSGAEPEAGGP